MPFAVTKHTAWALNATKMHSACWGSAVLIFGACRAQRMCLVR